MALPETGERRLITERASRGITYITDHGVQVVDVEALMQRGRRRG